MCLKQIWVVNLSIRLIFHSWLLEIFFLIKGTLFCKRCIIKIFQTQSTNLKINLTLWCTRTTICWHKIPVVPVRNALFKIFHKKDRNASGRLQCFISDLCMNKEELILKNQHFNGFPVSVLTAYKIKYWQFLWRLGFLESWKEFVFKRNPKQTKKNSPRFNHIKIFSFHHFFYLCKILMD